MEATVSASNSYFPLICNGLYLNLVMNCIKFIEIKIFKNLLLWCAEGLSQMIVCKDWLGMF